MAIWFTILNYQHFSNITFYIEEKWFLIDLSSQTLISFKSWIRYFWFDFWWRQTFSTWRFSQCRPLRNHALLHLPNCVQIGAFSLDFVQLLSNYSPFTKKRRRWIFLKTVRVWYIAIERVSCTFQTFSTVVWQKNSISTANVLIRLQS